MKYQSVLMTHADGGMHHLGIKKQDIAKNVILTPDPMMIDYYARFMQSGSLAGDYREYVTYTGTYKNQPLSIMSCGFGCMPMAIAIEELKHLDVENVIKIDTNVAIQDDIRCGDFVVAKGAIRGEGASREYIDISYPAIADMKLLSSVLDKNVHVGIFRSHDCENVESPYAPNGMEKIERWAKLGVDVLDGETSSMYIVASCLRMHAVSIALIDENYINGEKIEVSDIQRKKLFELAANCLIKKN